MSTTHTPVCLCPQCSRVLDAASHSSGERIAPKAGDLSVCLYCLTVLQFAEDLSVLALSQSQLDALAGAERKELMNALANLALSRLFTHPRSLRARWRA